MNVTASTYATSLTHINGLLHDASSVADGLADTFTLKGGAMPAVSAVMSARDEALRASELLWSDPMRTGDLTGTTVENSSILALQASNSLGRIADEMLHNAPQYGGPNGPSHLQIDAVTAQNALKNALAGVDQLEHFQDFGA